MEILTFLHSDCRKDECCIGYISEEEVKSKPLISLWVPRATIRLGNLETDGINKRVYPMFVKRREIKRAGLTPSFLKGD